MKQYETKQDKTIQIKQNKATQEKKTRLNIWVFESVEVDIKNILMI